MSAGTRRLQREYAAAMSAVQRIDPRLTEPIRAYVLHLRMETYRRRMLLRDAAELSTSADQEGS